MRKMLGLETEETKNKPLICLSLMGETQEEIMAQALEIYQANPDVIEWRADFYEDLLEKEALVETLNLLRDIILDKPILFTVRTQDEGGQVTLTVAEYLEVYRIIMKTELVDILDFQLEILSRQGKILIEEAHRQDYYVLLSYHDFKKTPSEDAMLDLMKRMDLLNGDIFKIAVMPKDSLDVLKLLNVIATANKRYEQPVIGISMGEIGKISRIIGYEFGSAMSFASLNGQSSAPGQIDIEKLSHLIYELS